MIRILDVTFNWQPRGAMGFVTKRTILQSVVIRATISTPEGAIHASFEIPGNKYTGNPEKAVSAALRASHDGLGARP
jgi:hypothetical protein